MSENEESSFDWQRLFNDFRRSASVKAGAAIFGEAQIAYYEVLKQHMDEEHAFNLLAHTTECIFKTIAEAAAPMSAVMLQGAAMWEQQTTTDKEVPGGS